jgi:hypothetical protein
LLAAVDAHLFILVMGMHFAKNVLFLATISPLQFTAGDGYIGCFIKGGKVNMGFDFDGGYKMPGIEFSVKKDYGIRLKLKRALTIEDKLICIGGGVNLIQPFDGNNTVIFDAWISLGQSPESMFAPWYLKDHKYPHCYEALEFKTKCLGLAMYDTDEPEKYFEEPGGHDIADKNDYKLLCLSTEIWGKIFELFFEMREETQDIIDYASKRLKKDES